MLASVPAIVRSVFALEAQQNMLTAPDITDAEYTVRLEHDLCMLTHLQYYKHDGQKYMDGPRMHTPPTTQSHAWTIENLKLELASLASDFPALPYQKIAHATLEPHEDKPLGDVIQECMPGYPILEKAENGDIHSLIIAVPGQDWLMEPYPTLYSRWNWIDDDGWGVFTIGSTRWRVCALAYRNDGEQHLHVYTRAHVGPGANLWNPLVSIEANKDKDVLLVATVIPANQPEDYDVFVPVSSWCNTSAVRDLAHMDANWMRKGTDKLMTHFCVDRKCSDEFGHHSGSTYSYFISFFVRFTSQWNNLYALTLQHINLSRSGSRKNAVFNCLKELTVSECQVFGSNGNAVLEPILGNGMEYTSLTKLHLVKTPVPLNEAKKLATSSRNTLRSLRLFSLSEYESASPTECVAYRVLEPEPPEANVESTYAMLDRLELLDLDLQCNKLSHFRGIRRLTNVKSLTLHRVWLAMGDGAENATEIEDAFSFLGNLTHLCFDKCEFNMLKPAMSVLSRDKLTHLEFHRHSIDISPILSRFTLTGLVSLKIQSSHHAPRFHFLRMVSQLTNLTELDMQNTAVTVPFNTASIPQNKIAEFYEEFKNAFGRLTKLKTFTMFNCVTPIRDRLHCLVEPVLRTVLKGPLDTLYIGAVDDRYNADSNYEEYLKKALGLVVNSTRLRELAVYCHAGRPGLVEYIAEASRNLSTLTHLTLLTQSHHMDKQYDALMDKLASKDVFASDSLCTLTLTCPQHQFLNKRLCDSVHQVATAWKANCSGPRHLELIYTPMGGGRHHMLPMSSPSSIQIASTVPRSNVTPLPWTLFDTMDVGYVVDTNLTFQRSCKAVTTPPDCVVMLKHTMISDDASTNEMIMTARIKPDQDYSLNLMLLSCYSRIPIGKRVTTSIVAYMIHDPQHKIPRMMRERSTAAFMQWDPYISKYPTDHKFTLSFTTDEAKTWTSRKRTSEEAFEDGPFANIPMNRVRCIHSKIAIQPLECMAKWDEGALPPVIAMLGQMMIPVSAARAMCRSKPWLDAASESLPQIQFARYVTGLITSGRLVEFYDMTAHIHPSRRSLLAAVCACLTEVPVPLRKHTYSPVLRSYILRNRDSHTLPKSLMDLIRALTTAQKQQWARLNCNIPEVEALGIRDILVPHTSPSMVFDMLSNLPVDQRTTVVSRYSQFLQQAGIEMRTETSPPPELCCALSAFSALARDPVLVCSSGISYSRSALEQAERTFAKNTAKLPGLFDFDFDAPKADNIQAVPNYKLRQIIDDVQGQ